MEGLSVGSTTHLIHHYHFGFRVLKLKLKWDLPFPFLSPNEHLSSKKILGCPKKKPTYINASSDSLVESSSGKKLPLMPSYAETGLYNEAEAIFDEILNSCYIPDVKIVSKLMDRYCRVGRCVELRRIVDQVSLRGSELVPEVYRVAISCLGRRGELEMMENILRDMVLRGYPMDFATGNAVVMYYSLYGSLTQMEYAYARLKLSRSIIHEEGIRAISFAYIKRNKFYNLGEFLREVGLARRDVGNVVWNLLILSYAANFKMKTLQREFLRMLDAGFQTLMPVSNAYARLKRSRSIIHEEGIRAISFAYIKRNKFYNLGEFLREVGLARRDVGNVVWNLLLLSYAANFKMKTLQREFLRMLDAGFHPDLMTFNIRAMAFSKMSLFWDLHLSLEHMKHEQVVPDLVTYGCVVDAYLDRRLAKNLDFASSIMDVHKSPRVSTDTIVFEVLGKGDFHASSEAFLEFKSCKDWTYKDLTAIYLKKKYRSNQVFWNY